MTLRIHIFTLLLFLSAGAANAQFTHLLSKQLENKNQLGYEGSILGMHMDANSNTYITGYIYGVFDFDPGPGVFNLSSFGWSGFRYSNFFAKYNASHQLVFAKALPAHDLTSSYSIVTDSASNIYIAGFFDTGIDFDPGLGEAIATSSVFTPFFARYDSMGNYVYHRVLNGTTGSSYAFDLKIDGNNNLVVTGRIAGIVDFDPGPAQYNVTTVGLHNSYFAHYDLQGNFIRVNVLAATTNSTNYYSNIFSFCFDSQNNIYISGYATANIDLDPGPGVVSIAATPMFIAKYSPTGTLLFYKLIQPGGTVGASTIMLDNSGNIGLAGSYSLTVDFDPGLGTTSYTSAGGTDCYIAKYDNSGNFLFVKVFGSTSNDRVGDFVFDSGNNYYLTGSFSNTVDFDPSPATLNLGPGTEQLYLAKYDPVGNILFAKHMPGNATNNEGSSICLTPAGLPAIAGIMSQLIDMNPSPTLTANLSSAASPSPLVGYYDTGGNYLDAFNARCATGTLKMESVNGVATDTSGNIYITGYFTDTVDFDPGPAVQFRSSAGGEDAFLAKYDALGNFVYALTLGNTGIDSGNAVVVDAAGNAYVTGSFNLTIDFDPGPGFNYLTSTGGTDIFLAKYDPLGNMVFAGKAGGTIFDQGNGIGLDANNNIYLTGVYRGSVDFDMGAGTANLSSSGGTQDIFVAKYTSSGAFVFAKGMSGTGVDLGHDIAVLPSGTFFLTGAFRTTVDFDPGGGVANLTASSVDTYIAKYDANGVYQYAVKVGGTNLDEGYAISADLNENAYVTGYFLGSGDYDPGAGVFTLTSSGLKDGFLLKLGPTGSLIYAINMGGLQDDIPYDVLTDNLGNAYVTGSFKVTCDFGPTGGTQNLTANIGESDIFLVKYDPSGNYLFGARMGGGNADKGASMVLNKNRRVLLAGAISQLADMDPSPSVTYLSSNNGWNIFFSEYKDCIPPGTPTISTASTNFCAGSSATLTVQSGMLNDATAWKWYSGSCGGTPVGTGSSIVVSPTATTTYFVRGEGSCVPNGACGSITLTYIPIPAPTVASSNSPVSLGGTINLMASTVPGVGYAWTGPNSFSSSAQNPSIPSAAAIHAGKYYVTTVVSGCTSAKDSVNVIVNLFANISGTIWHPNGVSRIRFTGVSYTGPSSGGLITGTDGTYNLPGLTIGGNYSVSPHKANDSLTNNGITTLDLVLMQRHILNQDTLDSPYKIIAADVNNSGSVTTLDILLTRTVVLQTSTTFPSGKLWYMVNSDHVFPNSYTPWPYASTRVYPSAGIHTEQNFLGVKLGDVNWSWNPNLSKTHTVGELPVYFGNSDMDAAGNIAVPVRVDDFDEIAGYQFTVSWDPSLLSFAGMENGATTAFVGEDRKDQGTMTVSWNDEHGGFRSLEDGSALFFLKFKAHGSHAGITSLSINSEAVNGEAYNGDLEILGIRNALTEIDLKNGTGVGQTGLLGCNPNPFSLGTTIRFHLQNATVAKFSILDLSGKVVAHFGGEYPVGTHEVTWAGRSENGGELSAGTYLLRFAADGVNQTLRLVYVKD